MSDSIERPDALFLENQADLQYIPKQYMEDNGFDALNDNPVGTGAYTLDSWQRDEQMIMSAKDEYFGGTVPIDTLEWQPKPEASSRLTGLTSGEVDLIRSASPQSEPRVENASNATLKKVRSARSAALWLNMKQNVFERDDVAFYDNLKLRQAVNYAIDVEAIIENILGGNAVRTHGWAPSEEYIGYNSDIEPYPFDPERARSLRDEAGYDAGDLSLQLLVPRERYPSGVASSEAIATMLGEVGIDVQLDAIEFGQFADQTQQGNIPGMMFAAWGNPKFNPLDAYLPLVMPGSIFSLLPENGQQDWVQEIGQKIQAAQTTVDREELDRQFQEIERILHEQAAFVFLFQYIDVYGADANLNWQPRSDEIMFMTNASWE